eukprot:GSChrysophyteH1.ASY1.ANO1.1158.1 assembled CDS
MIKVTNINVGILGHVDSGKTSLVKALSTSLSTAALDKNPQSQQRGITLDLGFSSFTLPMPKHITKKRLQFTLVDCPGHASLIKTIIGGAQIIDMIVLVIDANKGIQTQTAECIVIGEITTSNLIVVLNKIDMIPIEERRVKLERVTSRIKSALSTTKFADAPIVAASSASKEHLGIESLVDLLHSSAVVPVRDEGAPFYFAIDHCFSIKGHGTVLTGTILSGTVKVNEIIELPYVQQQRKVKSMQMFRKPVKVAKQGDRVGICVTNLDSSTIERGIAAAPGSVQLFRSVLCLVKKVRYFKGECKSSAKFHISIGHSTIIANVTFFGASELESMKTTEAKESDLSGFQWSDEFNEALQWAYLNFASPVYCPLNSLIIGSRLDSDTRDDHSASKGCRLAFFGPIKHGFVADAECQGGIEDINIYSPKEKQATIFKLTDVRSGGIFKTSGGNIGVITSPYGSDGKFKVKFQRGVPRSTVPVGSKLTLYFKRFIGDKSKSMKQSGSDVEEDSSSNSKFFEQDGKILHRIAIVSGVFRLEENIRSFIDSTAIALHGEVGTLVGPFAKMGKCKVKFPEGLSEQALNQKIQLKLLKISDKDRTD